MRIAILAALSVLLLANVGAGAVKECPDFIAKLETCSPYRCTFVHPFTGGAMERRIFGLKDGKCIYTEQMPNGGKMECAYTDSLRKEVVQQYKDTEAAWAAGKSQKTHIRIKSHIKMKNGKIEGKSTVEGNQTDNPLQKSLDSGQCVISGYE